MAHNPRSVPFAISRRNRNVNRLPERQKHFARPWLVEQRRDFAPVRFCGQRNASRARLRAKPAAHGPPVLERAYMCKANSHTEDSNAKTLPNSCLKAARFMRESGRTHSQKRRYSCPNNMKTTSKHRKNHAPKLRNSCRNLAQMLSTPHGVTRRRRLAPANPRLDSAAPPAIIVALQTAALWCRVPGNNLSSLSGTVGQWIALPAIGRRRCDSVSRSSLCARALPQRSRLRFRAASESS